MRPPTRRAQRERTDSLTLGAKEVHPKPFERLGVQCADSRRVHAPGYTTAGVPSLWGLGWA